MYEMLKEIETKLQGIDGIITLKIGLEANMTARDYPAIRITSSFNKRANCLSEDMEFMVYFGDNLHEKIGLEEIYKTLYEYEYEIRSRLDISQISDNGLVRWIDTRSDEDRLQGYKILVSRFVAEGVR